MSYKLNINDYVAKRLNWFVSGQRKEHQQQFFLELDALCWQNGLELSPDSIHKKLKERQQSHYETKAA